MITKRSSSEWHGPTAGRSAHTIRARGPPPGPLGTGMWRLRDWEIGGGRTGIVPSWRGELPRVIKVLNPHSPPGCQLKKSLPASAVIAKPEPDLLGEEVLKGRTAARTNWDRVFMVCLSLLREIAARKRTLYGKKVLE